MDGFVERHLRPILASFPLVWFPTSHLCAQELRVAPGLPTQPFLPWWTRPWYELSIHWAFQQPENIGKVSKATRFVDRLLFVNTKELKATRKFFQFLDPVSFHAHKSLLLRLWRGGGFQRKRKQDSTLSQGALRFSTGVLSTFTTKRVDPIKFWIFVFHLVFCDVIAELWAQSCFALRCTNLVTVD